MLSRDIVLSKKWRKAAVCKKYVTLEIKNGNTLEFHRYPALDPARVKPLRKLLVENKIPFSDFTGKSGVWYTPPPVNSSNEELVAHSYSKTRADMANGEFYMAAPEYIARTACHYAFMLLCQQSNRQSGGSDRWSGPGSLFDLRCALETCVLSARRLATHWTESAHHEALHTLGLAFACNTDAVFKSMFEPWYTSALTDTERVQKLCRVLNETPTRSMWASGDWLSQLVPADLGYEAKRVYRRVEHDEDGYRQSFEYSLTMPHDVWDVLREPLHSVAAATYFCWPEFYSIPVNESSYFLGLSVPNALMQVFMMPLEDSWDRLNLDYTNFERQRMILEARCAIGSCIGAIRACKGRHEGAALTLMCLGLALPRLGFYEETSSNIPVLQDEWDAYFKDKAIAADWRQQYSKFRQDFPIEPAVSAKYGSVVDTFGEKWDRLDYLRALTASAVAGKFDVGLPPDAPESLREELVSTFYGYRDRVTGWQS